MALRWPGGSVFRNPVIFTSLFLAFVASTGGLSAIGGLAYGGDTASDGSTAVSSAVGSAVGGVDALGSALPKADSTSQPVLSEQDQRQAEARLRAAAKGKNTESTGSLAISDPLAMDSGALAQVESELEVKINEHLAAAKEALKQDDFEKAIEQYKAVLVLDPSNSTAKRALTNAEKELQKAHENQLKSQARLEEEKRKQELEDKKNQAEVLYQEGKALYSAGQFEQAIDKFNSALSVYPEHRSAARDLQKATTSLEKAKADEAALKLAADEESLKADAEKKQAEFDQLYKEANSLAKSGQYQEAIASFDEALKVIPDHEGALKDRAKAEASLEKEKQKLAEAEQKAQSTAAKAEKAAEAKSLRDQIDGHIIAGKQALAEDDYEKAAREAHAALELEPVNRTARRILDAAEKELARKVTEAVPEPAEISVSVEPPVETSSEAITPAVESAPGSVSEDVATHLERGRTYLAAGLFDEAAAEFQAILDIDANNAEAQAGLNEVAQKQAGVEAAAAAELQAASVATAVSRADEAMRRLERGKFLDSQGDLIGAMEEWKAALALKSDLSEAQVLVQQKQQAYDEAVQALQKAEEKSAQEKEFEERLDKVYLPLVEFQDSDIDDVLTNLATTSEFDITAAADVEGTVTALLRNKTLREILDTLLMPNGWKWERVGNDIYVTTNFITEIFTLPPDEFKKLEDILLEPERLENPENSLQRMLWGDAGPKVAGTDLRLNPKTNQLIVTDSEANIEKVRKFLSNLPALAKAEEPLVTEIFPLKPELASKLHNIIKEALASQVARAREGRQLLLDADTNTLIIRDTQENLKLVEQILTDKAILEGITQGTLEARRFVVTIDQFDDEPGKFRRREIVTYTREILEHMLYTQEGREEAIIRGRRIFEGRVPDYLTEKEDWDYDGTITVVDTPDNLKRVESYLATVSGQRQVTRFMRVEHADVDRLKRLLDLVTGRVQETTTEGGSIIEDYGQVDPTGQFGTRLNLRVRLTADTISNSIIAIAPQVAVLDEIESLLRQMDLPEQQVEIEARLVEVAQEDIDNFNIDISIRGIGRSGLDPFDFNTNPLDIELLSAAATTGGTSLAFGILGETQLTLLLNYIRSSRTSEVLSAPKVTTVSAPETPATVDVSTEQPYVESAEFDDQGDDDPTNNRLTTQFATTNIGITLEVDPRVLPDGYVIMDINPVVSVLAGRLPIFIGGQGFENLAPALADLGQPIIDVREANVRVRVKDGDTLAIGGLIRDEVLMSEAKVPFFGDLPIIGGLFKDRGYSRTKTSLLILVTVRVIPSE